ncbi:MAG: tRNA pseudouridine(38-40) synthase TruA [Betaproteobacteria bacterium]|nr:tRNA pseudouridine(38-40) synthase TruA [Betaproteobacteria bacterium]
MRIALGLEYDGRTFCGWQSQPSGCGVQDALEHAIARIAGHPVRVGCAGRTDSGVHAHWQVAHFDTDALRPETAWTRGVNAGLPNGTSVLWARSVTQEFHARFSATGRRYRYALLCRAARPGLLHGRVGWWPGALDIGAMAEAARVLVGEHDFSAFRAAECQAKSPVRRLHRLDVRSEGDLIVWELGANGFLHHMVRNIVGSLVYVGAGRQPVGWVASLLAGRDRRRAAPTFAPEGLYLSGVDYDPCHGLPVPPPEPRVP